MRTIWKHELAVGNEPLGYEIPGYGGVAHVTRSGPGLIEHPVCPVCWLTHPEGACDR